jgi:hypothetical protein
MNTSYLSKQRVFIMNRTEKQRTQSKCTKVKKAFRQIKQDLFVIAKDRRTLRLGPTLGLGHGGTAVTPDRRGEPDVCAGGIGMYIIVPISL